VAAVVPQHRLLGAGRAEPVPGHANTLSDTTDISGEVKRRFLPGLRHHRPEHADPDRRPGDRGGPGTGEEGEVWVRGPQGWPGDSAGSLEQERYTAIRRVVRNGGGVAAAAGSEVLGGLNGEAGGEPFGHFG